MKILFLVNHLNVGGITSYILILTKGLVKEGFDVYVASSGGEKEEELKSYGLNFIRARLDTKSELSPRLWSCFGSLANFIRENKIDIIHSQSRTTQVLGYFLSKKTGAAHVMTGHGFFKPRFGRRLFPLWPKRIITVSLAVAEHFINDLGARKDSLAVVSSGVDVQNFINNLTVQEKDNLRKKFNLTNGPIISIIARLSPEKGHSYLIEAFAEIILDFKDARLLIVGEGREEENILRLVKKLQLSKQVIFLPTVASTKEILMITDIFVLPSLKEGLGLSLMEAEAAGCAVIGTAVGGIICLINDGVNGLLVPPADSKELAKAIKRLAGDPALRVGLGAQAVKYMLEKFSLEKMVKETSKIYLECV